MWLCLHHPLLSITSLHLSVDSPDFGQLIDVFSETLEDLKLVQPYGYSRTALQSIAPRRKLIIAHLDLRSSVTLCKLRALRSLYISIQDLEQHSGYFTIIRALLAQLPSRLLSFTLDVVNVQLTEIPWESFMGALKPFSNSLKTVEFKIRKFCFPAPLGRWGLQDWELREWESQELRAIEARCDEFLDCVKVVVIEDAVW